VEVKRSLATTSADQLVDGSTVPNVAQLQEATVQAKAYLAELGGGSGLTEAERDALGVRARIGSTRSIAPARATVAAAGCFGADHDSRFDGRQQAFEVLDRRRRRRDSRRRPRGAAGLRPAEREPALGSGGGRRHPPRGRDLSRQNRRKAAGPT